MKDWGKPNHTNDLFVESTNSEDLRAQRVWRLVAVMMACWLFFTFYFWWRRFSIAAEVCAMLS